jgi:hypothetical protein
VLVPLCCVEEAVAAAWAEPKADARVAPYFICHYLPEQCREGILSLTKIVRMERGATAVADFTRPTVGGETAEAVVAVPVAADGELDLARVAALAADIWGVNDFPCARLEVGVAVGQSAGIWRAEEDGEHDRVWRDLAVWPSAFKIATDGALVEAREVGLGEPSESEPLLEYVRECPDLLHELSLLDAGPEYGDFYAGGRLPK